MNYKKLFGLGALIWISAYITASLFVAYKAVDALPAKIIIPIVIGIVAYFAGKNLKLKSIKKILPYSIGWLVIGLILDVIMTVPFTGWAIFAQWNLWVGYALILSIPLLTAKK
tara:strand:+ start:80 stop:418 length:339 start_codon:yes stop_codon:yes gene_type:complete